VKFGIVLSQLTERGDWCSKILVITFQNRKNQNSGFISFIRYHGTFSSPVKPFACTTSDPAVLKNLIFSFKVCDGRFYATRKQEPGIPAVLKTGTAASDLSLGLISVDYTFFAAVLFSRLSGSF